MRAVRNTAREGDCGTRLWDKTMKGKTVVLTLTGAPSWPFAHGCKACLTPLYRQQIPQSAQNCFLVPRLCGPAILGCPTEFGDLGIEGISRLNVAEFLHLCVRTAYNQFRNLRDSSIPTLVFMESSCRGGEVILLSGNGAHPTGGMEW